MELIFGYLHQGLQFIIPLVILLGLLIFVHESGHFLVAKFFKVRVEVFSLGFGKKLFKFKKGDTEYCLSLIPFGGYVKMFGDELGSEISEDEKRYAFNFKPVGQRIAVVLAGPLMNFFFAILLFALIALVGEDVVRSTLGDISPQSAAYSAGLRSGDSIQKINNHSILTWDELNEAVQNSKGNAISLEGTRFSDNSPFTITAQTKLVQNKNILSSEALVGEIEGLGFSSRSTSVGISDPNSPIARAGIKTGYFIVSVDSKPVERWIEVIQKIDRAIAQKQNEVTLQFRADIDKTDSPTIPFVLDLSKQTTGSQALQKSKIETSDLYISKVVENTPAAKAGLKTNDRVVSIDNQTLEYWEDLVNKVQGFDKSQKKLVVSVLRDGQPMNFDITPELSKQSDHVGKEKEVYALGVVTSMTISPPNTTNIKTSNILTALLTGINKTNHWTKATALSFLRLVQNKVSAKSIGGPIMIGQLASKTFQIGLSAFLKIMAIISINLFVLNLLPIPILDGGHLLFYIIEALRGAPLSMRKLEIAQQIGLVLLMSLMVFALFNDITRLFQ